MSPLRSRFGVAGWLLVLVPLWGGGCGRPHVKGTLAVDQVLKAWTSDGFDGQSVVNVDPDPWSAGACSSGAAAIHGLDILICEYGDDMAILAGQKKITSDWTEQSVDTGAAVQVSRTILAITDRSKADPDGRTIARLIKAFRDLR